MTHKQASKEAETMKKFAVKHNVAIIKTVQKKKDVLKNNKLKFISQK